MDILIRFLIQALDTMDGRKGTADFYTQASIHYEIERQEYRINKRRLKQRAKILESGPLADDEEFDEYLQLVELTD